MRNIKIDMPTEVELALNILDKNGFDAYVVGGCVRDILLLLEPKDWDITTSALPHNIINCFKDYKIIETGLKHGTVSVIINNMQLEITTYRIDGEYKDNRHPEEVFFVDNLELDLKRRDFTINAMAYNKQTGIIDFNDGLSDLTLKQIKCVGNPDKRFHEDGLRILRALRFACVLGFDIELNTFKSIYENKELLKNISPERLSLEFNKSIVGDNFYDVMTGYKDVIAVFIPEIKAMFNFNQQNPYHQYDLWQHTLIAMSNVQKDLILRISMLFHDIGKVECKVVDYGLGHFHGHAKISSDITKNILKRLRYDNETIDIVSTLISYHDVEIFPTYRNVKRWLNKIGLDKLKLLLEVKKADIKSQNPTYMQERLNVINDIEIITEDIIKQNLCFSLKDLDINGHDLIENTPHRGKEVGEILNKLLDMVINEEIINDKDELLKFVRKIE